MGEPPQVGQTGGRGGIVALLGAGGAGQGAGCNVEVLALHFTTQTMHTCRHTLLPQRDDLAAIVAGYLSSVVAGAPVDALVDFYLAAKAEAVSALWIAAELCASFGARIKWTEGCVFCADAVLPCPLLLLPPLPQEATLQDGAGHKPAYNLRTLCRALEYAAHATPIYGLQASPWLPPLTLGKLFQGKFCRVLPPPARFPLCAALAVGRLCHVLPHAAGPRQRRAPGEAHAAAPAGSGCQPQGTTSGPSAGCGAAMPCLGGCIELDL